MENNRMTAPAGAQEYHLLAIERNELKRDVAALRAENERLESALVWTRATDLKRELATMREERDSLRAALQAIGHDVLPGIRDAQEIARAALAEQGETMGNERIERLQGALELILQRWSDLHETNGWTLKIGHSDGITAGTWASQTLVKAMQIARAALAGGAK